MSFSREAVAQALAARIAKHAPPGVSVGWEDDAITIHGPSGWGGGIWFGESEHFLDRQELIDRVDLALSSVQDAIVDDTYEAWPEQVPEIGLPISWARIEGEVVVLGFGDVLELEPIPLAEIAATPKR